MEDDETVRKRLTMFLAPVPGLLAFCDDAITAYFDRG